MDEQLPRFPWKLSAPESLVLLWGPETGDAWALKVAFLELVVRRTLILSAVEQRRLLRSPRSVNVLTPGDGPRSFAARPLQAVVEADPGNRVPGNSAGVPVVRFATAVFTRHFRRVRIRLLGRRWDRTDGGYVAAEVLPDLERLGLFHREASVRLGRFASTRWQTTPEGILALEELRRIMASGRESFGRWVEHDPELAQSYVERAGSALLLLGGMAPLLRRLRDRSEERVDAWRLDRAGAAGAGPRNNWGSDPFTAATLAGAFGPGPNDDLDVAFFTLSVEIDRAWDELHRSGGFFVSAGGAGGE